MAQASYGFKKVRFLESVDLSYYEAFANYANLGWGQPPSDQWRDTSEQVLGTYSECVDVIAESKATPLLVLRKPDAATERNAKKLGITVVRSVEECLVVLEDLQRQKENPKLLDRLRQSIGAL